MSSLPSSSVTTTAVHIPALLNGTGVTLAAIVYHPASFDTARRSEYSAIVVAHPGGGIKEQTAGLYASKLAESGFRTVAFDALYHGESSGEPPQLENPHVRTEDISAVVDYLTHFHMSTPVASVPSESAPEGMLMRNGFDGKGKDADALSLLIYASNVRTADAKRGAVPAQMVLIPAKKEDAIKGGLLEGWEYYFDRHANARCVGWVTARSVMLLVVGSEAFSKFMSKYLLRRAVSEDKQMYVVQNANHMQLYDNEGYVAEAKQQLERFFHNKLKA